VTVPPHGGVCQTSPLQWRASGHSRSSDRLTFSPAPGARPFPLLVPLPVSQLVPLRSLLVPLPRLVVREVPLYSESPPLPAPGRRPAGRRPAARAPHGLERLNAAPRAAAAAALLTCCRSRRWAARLADHRPYPDLGALLAAAGEASYDLSPADLAEALAGERPTEPPLGPGASPAARTALRAAHTAYESRFGHVFVVCLTGRSRAEALDAVLASLRTRLGNDPDEERATTAEELRGIALARLEQMVTKTPDLANDHRAISPPVRV
jgi:2-oxo-4-hydroxy-4-carboxy-5-ureidoimidazoline decarboxylase